MKSEHQHWASNENDIFIQHRPLIGEGYWSDAYKFRDENGSEYEVWVDQDGKEKIVEDL